MGRKPSRHKYFRNYKDARFVYCLTACGQELGATTRDEKMIHTYENSLREAITKEAVLPIAEQEFPAQLRTWLERHYG